MTQQAKPLDYAELTRPGRRWWRLPVAVLVFALLLGMWAVVVSVGFIVFGFVVHGDPGWLATQVTGGVVGPSMLLFTNLMLGGLIPIGILSTWAAQRIHIGYTHSVAGRFRWGWFAQLMLLITPLWLIYVGISIALSPDVDWGADPQIIAFLIIIWLTTPLQAAGEEYAFRGWILQNVGGLFTRRIVAWVIPTIISAMVFALMHMSLDPWVLIQLGTMAVAASVMTWRTGGLEAAIALHIVNNMVVMHFSLMSGGLDQSFVTPESSGTWDGAAYSLITYGAALALVWWWTARRRIPHTTVLDPRLRAVGR